MDHKKVSKQDKDADYLQILLCTFKIPILTAAI